MAEAIDGVLMEDGSKQELESATWYENPQTHEEFSKTIIYYWNQSVNGILKIGFHLRAAQGLLGKDKFQDLQKALDLQNLPLRQQKMCMEVSANDRIMGHFRKAIKTGDEMALPNDLRTLFAISKLDEKQFDSGVNTKVINPKTTMKDLGKLTGKSGPKKGSSTSLEGTLGGRINVKVENLKNAQHAKDLESAINTAIQGVVSQFKGVSFSEVKSISEMYSKWEDKQKKAEEKKNKDAKKKLNNITEQLVGLSDEEISQLPKEWQDTATRLKTVPSAA